MKKKRDISKTWNQKYQDCPSKNGTLGEYAKEHLQSSCMHGTNSPPDLHNYVIYGLKDPKVQCTGIAFAIKAIKLGTRSFLAPD